MAEIPVKIDLTLSDGPAPTLRDPNWPQPHEDEDYLIGKFTFSFYDMLTSSYWALLYSNQSWTSSYAPDWNASWGAVRYYGIDGFEFHQPDVVVHNDKVYLCIVGHFTDEGISSGNEPGVGANWATYWKELCTATGTTWKGEWQNVTDYVVGDLIYLKDKFNTNASSDFYGIARCSRPHRSDNGGVNDNRPARWVDTPDMIYSDPVNGEYSKVGELDITLDDCGWAFWWPYEINFNYYQGECKWNMDTLADELDESNNYRWNRKPLGLVTDRDEETKIWDMSNDEINLRVQVKTSSDSVRGDINPDLILDGDVAGSMRKAADGAAGGTTPLRYLMRPPPRKYGLKISEEGVRSLAHYFTKNGSEVKYGTDWLEPFSLKYFMFDTTDEEHIKVTRSLDYSANEVGGKFLNGFSQTDYKIYLMPRLTAYFGRSAEWYQENETREVEIAWTCAGVDPPTYPVGCQAVSENCTQPDYDCFDNFWGGQYDAPVFAYGDAYKIDYEGTKYSQVHLEALPSIGTERCVTRTDDVAYGWVDGVGVVETSHVCTWSCGTYDNCTFLTGTGCTYPPCSEQNISCLLFSHWTFGRDCARTYVKQHLGMWWDRIPNQFKLRPRDSDKASPTFCLNAAGSLEYEVEGVFNDESLEDAIDHAKSAGLSEDEIEYICGFNSLHVFAGIGDDSYSLNLVTVVDQNESNYDGEPLNFPSVPSGKALDTERNWGAREIFEYNEGMYDPEDGDYDGELDNWNRIWFKMREAEWVKHYYNNYENDGATPAPGDNLLQGSYDTVDIDMPWGIGFTPAPPGTLLAIIRKGNTDDCWYIWQRQTEDVAVRKSGDQFENLNYDELLSFYETKDFKTKRSDDADGPESLDRTVHWDQFSGVGRRLLLFGRVDAAADFDDKWVYEEDAQCPHQMTHNNSDSGRYASHCGINFGEMAGTISLNYDIYVLSTWYKELSTIND